MSLAVRQARADELPRTVDIRLAMIREIDGFDLDERRPGWRERYTDFYGDGMAAGTAAVLFAEDDGAFAGMACVYVLRNHRSEIFSEPSAIVSNVYVPPERRRLGRGNNMNGGLLGKLMFHRRHLWMRRTLHDKVHPAIAQQRRRRNPCISRTRMPEAIVFFQRHADVAQEGA